MGNFVPDTKKEGGAYFTITGTIGKIDEIRHQVIMENGTVILMNDIYEIENTVKDADLSVSVLAALLCNRTYDW